MKINLNHTAKVETLLAQVNGETTAHVFTSPNQLIAIAESAESRLAIYVAKMRRKGAQVKAWSGDSLPNAYKYSPLRNQVTLERGDKLWFITDLTLVQGYRTVPALRVEITPEIRKQMLYELERNFEPRTD